MKGSNPIIPPGAQFDGARRGRSNMRMAVVVVVLMHMALFAGILFNACKQKDEGEAQKETEQEMAGIVNRQPERRHDEWQGQQRGELEGTGAHRKPHADCDHLSRPPQ